MSPPPSTSASEREATDQHSVFAQEYLHASGHIRHWSPEPRDQDTVEQIHSGSKRKKSFQQSRACNIKRTRTDNPPTPSKAFPSDRKGATATGPQQAKPADHSLKLEVSSPESLEIPDENDKYLEWPVEVLYRSMPELSSPKKRQRVDALPSREPSYTQSIKDGTVPEQYTPAYEKYIKTQFMNMDILEGEDKVNQDSKDKCKKYQEMHWANIEPCIFPEDKLRWVINSCQGRNEAKVNRDITPMLIPPVTALVLRDAPYLEHVVDEVTTDWHKQCVLAGPRLRPDLAVGFAASAFSQMELDKLSRYNSVDNWTHMTTDMFFPFLMSEVKCGADGLDMADRQNMHSCSVAIRALLRVVQQADGYSGESKLQNYNGQILVFSLSHDQKDVRMYGHFAIVDKEPWTYYRYYIKRIDIMGNANDILAAYNFSRNVLKEYSAKILEQLQDSLKAFPEPAEQDLGGSTLEGLGQDQSQDGVGAGPEFKKPTRSASAMQNEEIARLREQVSELLIQNEEIARLREQVSELLIQNEEIARLREQVGELLIQNQKQVEQREKEREESKKEREQQHKEAIEREGKQAEQIQQLMSLLSKK